MKVVLLILLVTAQTLFSQIVTRDETYKSDYLLNRKLEYKGNLFPIKDIIAKQSMEYLSGQGFDTVNLYPSKMWVYGKKEYSNTEEMSVTLFVSPEDSTEVFINISFGVVIGDTYYRVKIHGGEYKISQIQAEIDKYISELRYIIRTNHSAYSTK